MVKPIEASGGLVVHPGPDGPQILLAHRPRYDDWTFPKGKNESGEDSIKAALREVQEETGQQPRVVSILGETAYPIDGTSKRVRWYGMRVNDPSPFIPNGEVDEIRWIEPDTAASLLSYDDDRQLLDSVDIDALLATGTLFLVRHAAAGERSAWSGDDRLRPISAKGQRQAAGLVEILADREIEAIITSPYVRCVQTVEPLAEARVLQLVDEDCTIMPGVRVRRTGGHTMHHQIVYIESGGLTAVFTADLIPTVAHLPEPWIMGFDLYPLDTLAFKRAFLREAIEREYLVFFEHDPLVAAGYIRERDGKKYVEQVL